jgi:RNA recognition motif-containing protein
VKNRSKLREIFVGDISFEATEEDLRQLFSVCGTVRAVSMLTDTRSGKFIGRAFICMATDAEAKDAIATLDGARLLNRCIRVNAAQDKPQVAIVQPAARPGAGDKKSRTRRPGKGAAKPRLR